MKNILGMALILLALAIAIIPQFTTCQSQGMAMTMANGQTVPMKCLWTARAEIVTGSTLFIIGLMMFFARKKESLRYLSALGVVVGVFVMLLPTVLIGVCVGTMLCDTVMKPTLLTLGFLVIISSLIGILSFRKGD